jgi:hypothetical protein
MSRFCVRVAWRECPILAQSGHRDRRNECPLSGESRTNLAHRRRYNESSCSRMAAIWLGAVAVGYLSGDDFAARLDRCIERASKAPKLIELKSDP